MTISYPLNLPTTPKPKVMTMIPESSMGRAESDWTLKQQIFTNEGDRWLFDLKYPPLTVAQNKVMAAFLCSVTRGGTFYVGDPKNRLPAGTISGARTVSGAHALGLRTLNITGVASAVNWLKAGDDIQIGSYLYKVLQDANVSGGGVCALDIFPSLRTALSGGEAIIYQDPKTLCRLKDGEASWSVDPDGDGIYDVEFSVIEALP